MKKSIFILAALATMVLAGCAKEQIVVDESPAMQTITISCDIADDPATRANIPATGTGNIQPTWESGDAIGVVATNSNGFMLYKFEMDGSPTKDNKSATFKGSVDSGYTVCDAFYPWSASLAGKHLYDLPSVMTEAVLAQTYTEGAFNKNTFFLMGEVSGTSDNLSVSLSATFTSFILHLKGSATIGKIEIVKSDEVISRLTCGSDGVALDASTAKIFAITTRGFQSKGDKLTFNFYDAHNNFLATKTKTIQESEDRYAGILEMPELTIEAATLGHDAFQLWVGSPFWATTNIGASAAEEAGYYFAWGYTQGYVRNGSNNGWVKADDSSSSITFDATGFSDYQSHTFADMATANWGTGWQLPQKIDYENLIANCDIEYVTTGTKGVRFTGKGAYSGNSIFLPAASFGSGSDLSTTSETGGYWATPQYDASSAYHFQCRLLLNSNDVEVIYCNKFIGRSVRPVLYKTASVTGITLNKTEMNIIASQTEKLSVSSIAPSNENYLTVTWSSSNTNVATVDAVTGVVTGVAEGTATITATANDASGVTATCTVNVKTYKTGDYLEVDDGKGSGGKVAGVVFFYDGKPYLLSIDETTKIWNFADDWCEDHGAGWYLPSRDELLAIKSVRATLNETLKKYPQEEGVTNKIQTGVNEYYWSSKEVTKYAAVIMMGDIDDPGVLILHPKTEVFFVRAVRAL